MTPHPPTAVDDETTWSILQSLLLATGITRMSDVTRLDGVGIPVWQAIRPLSLGLAVAQGKGRTDTRARISATMEALEQWATEHPPEPDFHATWGEVAPQLAYSLDDLVLHERHCVNSRTMLGWLPAITASGKSSWLPREHMTIDWGGPERWTPLGFASSSEGLAGGLSATAAMLHGLYETIEHAAWGSNVAGGFRQGSTLDLSQAIANDDVRWLLAQLDAAGIQVRTYDLTGPVGVAVVYCELLSSDYMTASGSGCNLNREIALSRAIFEAAQSRLTFIAGSRDDLPTDLYAELWSPPEDSDDEPRPPVRLESVPSSESCPPAEELQIVTERVTAHTGREPLFVNLSRPEIDPVQIWRCLSPGLGHHIG